MTAAKRLPLCGAAIRSMRAPLVIALVASLLALPAAAAECELQRVASLDLVISPGARGIFMPVTLNNVPKLMLVDTGGVFGTLAPDIVDELSLSVQDGPPVLVNVGGQVLSRYAVVDRFSFGGLRPMRAGFLIEPANSAAGTFGGSLAGVIAPNILRQFDIEIDLAQAKINFFKPNECANPVYWPSAGVAAIKADVRRDGHIIFPMWLDGQKVMSILDTGMSLTSLDLETARRDFGVDIRSGNLERVGSLNDTEEGTLYRRAFKSLATADGSVSVLNPRIVLLPDLTNRYVKRDDAKLILGLSILQRLHLYIAYGREMVFLTPASGPPAAIEPLSASDANSSRGNAPDGVAK